jgi:hypothetical protein
MNPPMLSNNIMEQLNKSFYLYQNYMVWTWAPYWFYNMAVVQTIIRVTGGMIVSVFQYMSDSVLFPIAHVSVQVEYVPLKLSVRRFLPQEAD